MQFILTICPRSVVASFAHSIETGTPYEMEHRCRRADGVYRWFQVRALPVRDTDGGITGWYVLLIDIDDRKHAEDALQASERGFSSIVNAIPAMAWSARPDGFCDFLNQPWLDFTGLTADEACGWGWGGTIHPDDVAVAQWIIGAIGFGFRQLLSTRKRVCVASMASIAWFLFRASPFA